MAQTQVCSLCDNFECEGDCQTGFENFLSSTTAQENVTVLELKPEVSIINSEPVVSVPETIKDIFDDGFNLALLFEPTQPIDPVVSVLCYLKQTIKKEQNEIQVCIHYLQIIYSFQVFKNFFYRP
jgi:hypothetical protein